MKQFEFKGQQTSVVQILRELRKNWGPPGGDWSYSGNYKKILLQVKNPQMIVWLALQGFTEFRLT